MKNRPWLQALALCLFAIFPAVGAIFLHPRGPAWSREVLAADEVTLAGAEAFPDLVWIDARSDSSYAKEHIPGAVSLNEDRWNELLMPFALQFLPTQNLVVYCDSLECNASHQVAERLRRELGAKRVFVLKGGWQTWKKQP